MAAYEEWLQILLSSRFCVYQQCAPPAADAPDASLFSIWKVHHRPPRKCLGTDPAGLKLAGARFDTSSFKECVHMVDGFDGGWLPDLRDADVA
jgi:hypothetical protein